MPQPTHVQALLSSSPEYHQAFKTFLAHTDQKEKALAWLQREVQTLDDRTVLIDAGAGSGKLTSWFEPDFARIIALEPNASLAAELRAACPRAEVIPATIAAMTPPVAANFILCSHVFYYIPKSEWESSLQQLMGWLAPGGVLAIALQNPESDCMRMVQHFLGGRYDVRELGRMAEARGGPFEVWIETVPAQIHTHELDTARQIAEFVLNVLAMPSPPSWSAVESYLEAHWKRPDQGYRFSCDQDFLRVARRT